MNDSMGYLLADSLDDLLDDSPGDSLGLSTRNYISSFKIGVQVLELQLVQFKS